ncbi:MAG: heme-binding protein [Dehalococcoidia bacterium]|nr:heme-binding protein [Dehalococcoidia bacterium]
MAFENPPYRVLKKEAPFELRSYDNYIVAEVELAEDYDGALSAGFRILADYIFGNNHRSEHIAMTVPVTEQGKNDSEKVAMTAPVTSQVLDPDRYRVAFMMPSKYAIDTLPVPEDTRISFRTIDAHRAAAVRFSGSFTEKTAHSRTNELLTWIAQQGLEAVAAPLFANYSPPWIPPFLRRNEVIVDLGPSVED